MISRYLNKIFVIFQFSYNLDMIIVCFIYFDNSLFWPFYGYIRNAKTFLLSNVQMKKIPISSRKKITKKKSSFSRVNCVCMFPFGHFDYRHISRATTMYFLSLHILGPRVLCPLTIGISAVVYFFASTGNFPCKYNNKFKLVLRMHKKINTN